MRWMISLRLLPTISSMRAGWMRPSAKSRSRVTRATSRRTGSNPERTTASGVSSTMTSTPVAASSARMLRPSRPMIRALEVVAGEVHDGHRRLPGLVGGVALHGRDEDLAAALVGLLADAVVGGADPLGDLGVELSLHLREQLGASLLLGQAGDALELAADQLALALGGLAELLELLLAAGEALLALLELADAPLQRLLALAGALLEPGDLGAALADVGLGLPADPEGLLAGADQDLLGLLLSGLLSDALVGVGDAAALARLLRGAARVDDGGNGEDHGDAQAQLPGRRSRL